MQDLTRDSLVDTLSVGQADSVFVSVQSCLITNYCEGTEFYNVYCYSTSFPVVLYYICPLGTD